MSFYHVYSARQQDGGSVLMQLAYETPSYKAAVHAADLMFAGRNVPMMQRAQVRPPGHVTGAPVYVRNKHGNPNIVMITEHPSREAASAAQARRPRPAVVPAAQ